MAISVDNAQQIFASEEEIRRGQYSPQTLLKFLGAMNHDGVVVLKNVVPVDVIEKLNTKMCEDANKKIADPSQVYNHGVRSNILQRPPITDPDYLHKDVYFNPFLLQFANAYLGPRPVWNWLTSNVALANTQGLRQPAHKDCSFDHPLMPYMFIANIPLVDFSAANGATEFWLGSHALTTSRDQETATEGTILESYHTRVGEPLPVITEEAKRRRLAIRPPCQPTCCRGDILVRDIRTWHAGMPNASGAHRIMLALGYQSPYYPNYTMMLHLPYSHRQFFLSESSNLVEVRAQWYSDEGLEKSTADTEFLTRPAYLE